MQYAYPCTLEPEEEEGFERAFNVSFPDLPGALTCGNGLGEALENAEEVLELVLGSYVEDNEEIPTPSPAAEGQELVVVRPLLAAKLSLYTAMREQNISHADLAERLGLRESTVSELLDPDRNSPISQVLRALQVVGRRLVLEDRPADGGTHFCYPASSHGAPRMDYGEFIRRVRRYALAHDLQWRIEDTAFYEDVDSDEEGVCLLRVGDHAVTLPDHDLDPEFLASTLKDLNIDRREF